MQIEKTVCFCFTVIRTGDMLPGHGENIQVVNNAERYLFAQSFPTKGAIPCRCGKEVAPDIVHCLDAAVNFSNPRTEWTVKAVNCLCR